MAEQVSLSDDEAEIYASWAEAADAERRWKALKEEAASRLLELAGYVKGESKPPTRDVVNQDGKPLFTVKTFPRPGVSTKLVQELYPEVAAECATTVWVKTIQPFEE